jgi:hypothetical protein
MTKAKRLNDSTAHFSYAVVACIFDQSLQIVYHIILNHVIILETYLKDAAHV